MLRSVWLIFSLIYSYFSKSLNQLVRRLARHYASEMKENFSQEKPVLAQGFFCRKWSSHSPDRANEREHTERFFIILCHP